MKEAKTYSEGPARIFGEAKTYSEGPARIFGEAFLLKEEEQKEINEYLLREFSKEMERYQKKTRITDSPLFWFIIAIIFFLLYICTNI